LWRELGAKRVRRLRKWGTAGLSLTDQKLWTAILWLLLTATFKGLREEIYMLIDDVPISYDIKLEKDHASVKVTYDLGVPVGGPALIADFQVTVDGTDLISGFLPGQTAFSGAKFHTLSDPNKDAPVSFTLSSNQGWVASDEDVLRGEKDYDEAEFSN
jgi:hypothetical protein